MRFRSLLLSTALLAPVFAGAQVWVADSITMGPGYGNDVFYSLQNSTVHTEDNHNWDLAFEMGPAPGPHNNVGVWANHVQDTVAVWSLHMQASTMFDIMTAADTTGLTGTTELLYNTDTNWNFGAFNRNNDASDYFNYGWGEYDMVTHIVSGDSIYLVRQGNQFYKLWIQSFVAVPTNDSMHWNFRIANLDGTGDTTISFYRGDSLKNRLFGYYSIRDRQTLDREPADTTWDIEFTRYIEPIIAGPGGPVPYPVTGVLSNFDVEVADVRHVVPDTALYTSYAMDAVLDQIGSDWKVFNITTFTYDMDDSATYFIKAKDGINIWQLQFTAFGGGSNGKVWFNKRQVATTAVNDVHNNISRFYVAPVPANNATSLVVDMKAQGSAMLTLTDINGRAVISKSVELNTGLNAFDISTNTLPEGMYLLSLNGNAVKLSQKVIVAR